MDNKHDVTCSYCQKKSFSGYRFKCVECDDYDLCDRCFGKKRCNFSHEIGHKIVRYDEPDKLFGMKISSDDVYLENLINLFKNETHTNIKCNICNMEPIKGLRFKCETCTDFNMCMKCSNLSSGKHSNKSHPVLVIGRNISKEIDFKKVKILKELGSGAFGCVYKAEYGQKIVACKIIEAEKFTSTRGLSGGTIKMRNDSYDELLKSYFRELDAYNEIKSDNILRMIGYCRIETDSYVDRFVILTEFMEKGNLESLLTNESELTYRKRLLIAANVAAGMHKIHMLGFIHRDIRPANILVNINYVAKIGDMGIAKIFEENSKVGQTVIGYRPYMPPEFETGMYTQKLDIFTYGLTLNELFNGTHGHRNGMIRIKKRCQVIYDDFVKDMVRYDPDDRPTSKEIDEKLYFISMSIIKILAENNEEYYKTNTIERRNEIFVGYYKKALNNYNEKNLQEDERKRKEDVRILLIYFQQKLKNLEDYNSKSQLVPLYLRILCSIYFSDRNKEKCFECFNRLLLKTREIFQGNNIENADALSIAGTIQFKLLKDTNKAIEFYNRALEMRKSLQIKDDPNIAKDYYHLGQCYQEVNLTNDALNAHLKSLELRKKIYEAKSKYIVDSLIAVQECYIELNKIDEYLKYRRDEVEIKKVLFNKKNPGEKYRHLQIIRELGGKAASSNKCYYVLVENEDKYEELMRKGVRAHADISECGKILAENNGGEFSESLRRQIERDFKIDFESKFEREFRIEGTLVKDLIDDGDNDRDPILNCLYNDLKFIYDLNNGQENVYFIKDLLLITDYLYNVLNDSFNSLLFATKARGICMKLFNNNESEFSIRTLSFIAACHLQNNPKQALEEYKKLLEIKKKVYGENYPTVANTFENIGTCYFELCVFKEALNYYLKALEIRRKTQDKVNKYTASTLKKIAECYDILDDMDNYLKYHKEELAMREELLKNNKPGKKYKAVVLLRNKQKEDTFWHYIRVDNEKKFEEWRKAKNFANVKTVQYGKVLKSGRGYNPSRNVAKKYETENANESD